MRLRIPFRFNITASFFLYCFAAFNGLAYYGFIRLIFDVLSFEKGMIRFVLNIIFLLVALLVYYKSVNSKAVFTSAPWPLGVKLIFAYFILSGISFFWGDAQGFMTQGFDMSFFYLAQWGNYLIEFMAVLLVFRLAPISKLAISYLKGLEMGGFLLAAIYLLYWLASPKTGRLAADYDIRGGVIHPTMLALKLSLSLLCSIHLFFSRDSVRKVDIIRFVLVASIMFFVIFMTIGKAALAGLALSVVFYILNSPIRASAKFWTSGFISIITLAALPYIAGYISNYIEVGGLSDFSGRTELWEQTWLGIQSKPWLGHGINTPFPTLWWNADRLGQSGQAHNEYLNVLYQLGLLGLAIVGTMYLSILVTSVQAFLNSKLRIHATFCLSVFILMFVNSLMHSFPVGFCIPVTVQSLLMLWLSKHWNSERDEKEEVLQDV